MPNETSQPEGEMGPEWHSKILDIDSLCLTACVCPCIVYGKTQHRIEQQAQHKDATDMSEYHTFNKNCGLMALLCGSQAFLAMFQRNRVRELYEINGSVGKDIATGFCCLANSLAQHEREVVQRETSRQQHADTSNGMSKEGCTRPREMQYAAPT